jgi:hypothetical protein
MFEELTKEIKMINNYAAAVAMDVGEIRSSSIRSHI